jgi:hypothetical protein
MLAGGLCVQTVQCLQEDHAAVGLAWRKDLAEGFAKLLQFLVRGIVHIIAGGREDVGPQGNLGAHAVDLMGGPAQPGDEFSIQALSCHSPAVVLAI